MLWCTFVIYYDKFVVVGVRYYFRSYAPNVQVKNVKMVGGWTYNTDGIATGDNGTVSDTFIFSNDDSIKLYSSNMIVEDTIIWQQANGGTFQLGWWGSHSQRNISVARVTVIHREGNSVSRTNSVERTQYAITDAPSNDGLIDLRGPTSSEGGDGSYEISDVVFTNITVEGTMVPRGVGGTAMPSGCAFLLMIDLGVATGYLENITLMNIQCDAQFVLLVLTSRLNVDYHAESMSNYECRFPSLLVASEDQVDLV